MKKTEEASVTLELQGTKCGGHYSNSSHVQLRCYTFEGVGTL